MTTERDEPPDAGGRRRGRWTGRLPAAALVGLVLLSGVVVAVRLERQHTAYGVWGWSPAGATPVLPFGGRHYRRTGTAGGTDRAGLVLLETVPGGAILGPPRDGEAPTSLVLRLTDGDLVAYSLSGGP